MLPDPPAIELKVTSSEVIPKSGFLRVRRSDVVLSFPNGTKTTFTVDALERKIDDAVCIIPYDIKDSVVYVYLRSCVRPSISLRDFESSKIPERALPGNTWELPAGLLESNEVGENGLKSAAARELLEEVGFDLPSSAFSFLGNRSFAAGGLSGERIFYLSCRVFSELRKTPVEDGSPLEMFGEVLEISLDDALKAVESGLIADSKSEIALYRLQRMLLETGVKV